MTDSTEAKADGDNVNWEVSRARMVDGFGCYCQARPRTQPSPNPVKPRSQSVPRGLGLTLKSHGPPTNPPHPITFKRFDNDVVNKFN